ncbi:MAG: hypothetical protein ACHQVS_02645 [Candidatus Babeliales bacterium]
MKYITSNSRTSVLVSSIMTLTFSSAVLCDPIITLFIRPYPTISSEYSKQLNTHLSHIGTIAHNTLHGLIQPCIGSGIFATYAGFLNVSDCNGQLQFPRKQEHPLLHVLITDRITPILINGMTVHHWELDPQVPVNFYSLAFKQDPDTHLYYWEVQHASVPTDNIIPLDTIIIFADAYDIYLPAGITLADNTPNFVLPPLYIKEHVDITALDMYVLNVKHFFGALHFLFKKQDGGYTSLLAP